MSVQIEKPKGDVAAYELNRVSMALMLAARWFGQEGIVLRPVQPTPESESPLAVVEVLSDEVGETGVRELVFNVALSTPSGVQKYEATFSSVRQLEMRAV